MRAVGIIPARYGSTRFPGKPLADLCGKPLIQWVWEAACQSHSLSRVLIATDDVRIRQAVEGFGGEAVMTASHHLSGTDRVAEAAGRENADIVVNIQGDEPLIRGEIIDDLVSAFGQDSDVQMATLATAMSDEDACADPNVVKVVMDRRGDALYFSRHPIPFVRIQTTAGPARGHLQHIGLYGFRREFLLRFTSLDPTPLEKTEGLEQLRALEHGFRIRVIEVSMRLHSVDTPNDLRRVKESLVRNTICGEVHCAQ